MNQKTSSHEAVASEKKCTTLDNFLGFLHQLG